MLKLKVLKGPSAQGQSFSLQAGRAAVVGRADDCEIRLAATGVSKKHCRLTVLSSNQVEVEDLGSSNGTFVNGLLVKRHMMRPGDTVSVHNFLLQLMPEAPQAVNAPPVADNNVFQLNLSPSAAPPAAPAAPSSLADRVDAWLDANVYPWADRLSERYSLRVLVASFFAIWSLLIILFTLSPFSSRANQRVQEQSIEVARLYARQLVRLNQQQMIEERYADLVTSLDSKQGQTPGLIEAMVVDVQKGQILAPASKIGQSVSSRAVVRALQHEAEHVELESDGIAYVSAPIKIASEGANKVVAAAVVVFSTVDAQFTLATLVDQAVGSMLYALIASALFILFLNRWIEGTLRTISHKLDAFLKGNGDATLSSPVTWAPATQLCEQISVLMGRVQEGGGGAAMNNSGGGEWAIAAVGNCSGVAAAAFDAGLKVSAWNSQMEKVIGIRASIAMGADISEASRDFAFENAIRELATQSAAQPWMPLSRNMEFSGRDHKVSMVSGSGAHFITITPAGDS